VRTVRSDRLSAREELEAELFAAERDRLDVEPDAVSWPPEDDDWDAEAWTRAWTTPGPAGGLWT
jgi:hypothetical protein